MKNIRNQANPVKERAQKSNQPKPKKKIFELTGPCGKLFVQARTPDQARGVYLAKFRYLPRNLEAIVVTGESQIPHSPYCVIQSKGKSLKVVTRFP